MAQTKWGIVYGTARPHIRQHVLCDDDSHYAFYPLSPGEKMILVPYIQGETYDQFIPRINAAVQADCGQAVQDLKFAEVDANSLAVLQVHNGDVAFYRGPNLYIDLSPALQAQIGPGCTYIPATAQFTVPQPVPSVKLVG